MKALLFIFLFTQTLLSNEQIVFVLAKNLDSTKATLIRYEKQNNTFKQISEPIPVNLGSKGLAWSNNSFDSKIIKKEGDKKAPAGSFKLSRVYGYENHVQTLMPYKKSSSSHICVDDSESNSYNQIIKTKNKKNYKSYENMLLSNDTYKYVIVVEHNEKKIKGNGSCIFIHVENKNKPKTAGCTSMKEKHIKKLVSWLDISKKPILIQIPLKSCSKYQKDYPFLNCALSLEN